MMGENPRHGSCVNRSSTRSPTNRTQVSTSSPPPVDMCTPAFQIEEHLNGVYEKRIAEIEQLASGDANLKEVTYVEWINMLRQVNRTLIINVQDLQHETSERLSLLQRKVGSSCRFSQDSELNKYRNDVGALIQLVRNGRRNADWSVDKLHFETVTESDIFGNEMSYCEPTMKSEPETTNVACSTEEKANFECQKAKLTANVKALAFEVAEKHDEIRDLKKQILSMEDEIQNAQKKIQLKDDVIKELRNDLRSLPKCNNLWGVTSSNTSRMSIKSSESDVSSICTPGEPSNNKESSICGPVNALHISFPEEDNDQEELIKRIKEEFSQLRRNYDQNIDEQTRAMDEQYNRFSGMIDQLSKTSSNLQKKLKFYRQKLLDLGNPQSARTLTNSSDVDSGISTDSDADVKNINSIRERLCCLTEETQRLVREQQNMQMKLADANGKAKAKSDLLEKASKALQEVADLLENTMHKPIAYENIFSECQTTPENPIVEAVDELIKDLMEKNKIIDELRSKISNTDGMNQGQEHCGNQLRCDVNESV